MRKKQTLPGTNGWLFRLSGMSKACLRFSEGKKRNPKILQYDYKIHQCNGVQPRSDPPPLRVCLAHTRQPGVIFSCKL